MKTTPALLLALTFTFLTAFSTQAATVPAANQFKFVNQGDFGERSVEYFADYRVVQHLQTTPFAVCFYNTTPNAFSLAIRMGNAPSESFYRWVWHANRASPVKENASLALGKDGNLVLAEANGKVVWQTNTANKNVVGLSLLSNGNLVLLDNKGKFVWQSFDYPTDTLLVGQSFRSTGVKRLVSRVSPSDGSQGAYSYGIDGSFLTLKYQVKNSKQFFYYGKSFDFGSGQVSLANLTFVANPENEQNHAYEVGFSYTMNGSPSSGTTITARPKYNATLSFIRIDFDGNLRIYTLDPLVEWGTWDISFVQFTSDPDALNGVSECNLPKRCGLLGVCEDNQCVACPRPQGLLGWSKECLPPVLPPCNGRANANYYKVVGAEHYSSQFNDGTGPIKAAECQKKCDSECKCVGFFYKAESSKCLMVPEIGTIVKVSNSSHVAYIKKSAILD